MERIRPLEKPLQEIIEKFRKNGLITDQTEKKTENSTESNDSEGIEAVELTEEEMKELIFHAKWRKYEYLRQVERENKRQKLINYFYRQWSAEEFLEYTLYKASLITYRDGSKFVIDQSNVNVIELLCYYFTDDERFLTFGEKEFGGKYSLHKGILLRGPYGTGKSEIMKLFSANPKMCYDFISSDYLRKDYIDHNDVSLARNATFRKEVGRWAKTFYQDKIGKLFDDFGLEGSAASFGPSVVIMQKIMQLAYDNPVDPYFSRHATTMLTPDQLDKALGEHVTSRMNQMFNDIILDGENRRK